MKPGNLLKRVSSNQKPRGRITSGGAIVAKEDVQGLLEKQKYNKPCNNTPTKSSGKYNNKMDKGSSGGGIFSRLVNRRKKVLVVQQQQKKHKQLPKQQKENSQSAAAAAAAPCTPPSKPERRLESATPVTLVTETGTEVTDTPLSLPPCERVPSYAETTQTQEVSDFSSGFQEEDELLEKRTRSFKRTSSAKTPASRMILDTSAVPFGMSRSMTKLVSRRTGNESLGDAKPNQPRRGLLPPILGGDGDESVGESSCSGITMDFTYGEENIKTPKLHPNAVGRLGEGVKPTKQQQQQQHSFVPPTYITMDDDDDDDDDDDLGFEVAMFGDF